MGELSHQTVTAFDGTELAVGVPTLVIDGEPFFGQDRIAMAQWRMEQKGLVER